VDGVRFHTGRGGRDGTFGRPCCGRNSGPPRPMWGNRKGTPSSEKTKLSGVSAQRGKKKKTRKKVRPLKKEETRDQGKPFFHRRSLLGKKVWGRRAQHWRCLGKRTIPPKKKKRVLSTQRGEEGPLVRKVFTGKWEKRKGLTKGKFF